MKLTPAQKIILEDSPELLAEFIPDVKDGEPGHTPTDEEITALIKPLIPEPIKGDDGDDYILTEDDKAEIASKIEVPIVEKVIEKTHVVHELPIVTKEIKEVAVADKPEVLAEKLNTLTGAVDVSVINGALTSKDLTDGMAKLDGRVKLIDQRWHGAGLSRVSTDATLTGDGTPSNPLSAVPEVGTFLKLDQTTPQSVINGQPIFTQGLKITAGQDIRPSADSTTAINIAQADGTDFVTFDTTNKRVGIGTTSPDVKLHIVTPTGTGPFRTVAGAGGYWDLGQNSGGLTNDDTFGWYSQTYGPAHGYLPILLMESSTGNIDMALSTNSVGIGTNNPLSKLWVKGSITTGGVNETLTLEAGGVATGDGPGLSFASYAGNVSAGPYPTWRASQIGGINTNSGTSGWGGALVFKTNTGASQTDLSEKMRIDNAGNVGIGTTAPGEQLEVKGTGAATDGIKITTSAYTSIPNPGSTADAVLLNARGFSFSTDSATLGASYQPTLGVGIAIDRVNPAFSIKNSATRAALLIEQGRLGIGTATPNEAIEVTGNIITSWGTRRIGIQYQDGTSYRMGMLFSDSGRSVAIEALSADTSDGIKFNTGTVGTPVERMRILQDGNVGVGVAAPTARLHLVAGTATASTAPLKFTSGTLNTNPEAGAVEFLTDKYYATITTGAVRKEIALRDTYYGGMYSYENANVTTIEEANVYHAVSASGIIAGSNSGFTWTAGVQGAIASVADYSGTVAGTIKITVTAGHNLTTNDYITIHGTTNYNGKYQITVIAPTTFYVTKAYVSSQTGTYSRGARLVANTGSAGTYRVSYNISGFTAGNNKNIKLELVKNLTDLDNTASIVKYNSGTDYQNQHGEGMVTIADGDHIYMIVNNKTDGTNYTFYMININLIRI